VSAAELQGMVGVNPHRSSQHHRCSNTSKPAPCPLPFAQRVPSLPFYPIPPGRARVRWHICREIREYPTPKAVGVPGPIRGPPSVAQVLQKESRASSGCPLVVHNADSSPATDTSWTSLAGRLGVNEPTRLRRGASGRGGSQKGQLRRLIARPVRRRRGAVMLGTAIRRGTVSPVPDRRPTRHLGMRPNAVAPLPST
jgi:hypothetical protein